MSVTEAADVLCRVFDIQRFSVHDGPGIRTTVFLEGCPLRCGWCQNPEAFSSARSREMTGEAIVRKVLADRPFYEASGGGMTVSGGEPLLHPRALRALLEAAKREGLHTCVQTSAAVPEASVLAVLDVVDLFQLDLKHVDARRHRELTGLGNERIHANARLLLERGADVQLRMPVLPALNDDDEHLTRVAALLATLGASSLRLVPYHRLYLDKYAALGLRPPVADLVPPSDGVMARVKRTFERLGVSVAVDA